MSAAREPHAACVRQTIPSRMEEAEGLCLKIRDMLQAMGLSQVSFSVELLARESLANAVNHGNANDQAKSVALQLQVGRTWICLQVTDEGVGFAWKRAMQKRPEIGIPSGRGLRIYERYASRLRINRCGNRITFWINKNMPTVNGD